MNDRLTFVTAQCAGRLRPDHLQLADVTGVDVGQFAVARQFVVTAWSPPFVWVGRPLLNLGVSQRRAGNAKHGYQEAACYQAKLFLHFGLLS